MSARLTFAGAVVLTILLLSWALDGRAETRSAAGTVMKFTAGESITIIYEGADPGGIAIALREATSYEGNRSAIKPGTLVTVRYRSVGERQPVADMVRVHAAARTHQ